MKLNLSLPINPTSFGNISYNILRELYNRGIQPFLFPVGQIDISSFDKASEDFKLYLQSCCNKALSGYKKSYPELRLWHIAGSETSHSSRQSLLTFLEVDSCTPYEVNILNNQETTFVTSNYTKDILEENGVKNVKFLPLGFDSENFSRISKPPYDGDVITFGILGKWEKRKHTAEMIKLWAKIYGNNPKYRLHLHCYNGFLHQDPATCAQANANLIGQALEGKRFWNINVINNHLRTSAEYNALINSCNILLNGGNENWGIPAFTAAALGKYVVTMYSNGVKDWANKENAVLVDPVGKEPAADGLFFGKEGPFNIGNIFSFHVEGFSEGMEKAEEKFRALKTNVAGLELQKTHTWCKTVDILLNNLS